MSNAEQLPERHPFGGFMRRYMAMRAAQAEFFRHRTNRLLQDAKAKEKELDEFADRFFEKFPEERPKSVQQTSIL